MFPNVLRYILPYRENTFKTKDYYLVTHNTHTMELFLLFSLALTLVAFLSIVLAEAPAPLTGVEADLSLGNIALPIATVKPDQGAGISGSALITDELEPTTALATVEGLQAMY